MRNSELKKLLEEMNGPMLYETGGGNEYISPNIYTYTGIYAEEFSANRDLFPGKINAEDYVEANHKIREWHKHNEPGILVNEFRFKTSFGEFIWIEDYIMSVKPEGRPKYMAGIMIDITAEKLESIELLQKLFVQDNPQVNTIRKCEERLQELDNLRKKRKAAAEKIAEIIIGQRLSMEQVFISCLSVTQ